MIELFQNDLRMRLLRAGADLVGFADLSDIALPGATRYRTAVAIGIGYDPEVVSRLDSQVEAFERHLFENRIIMEHLLIRCEQMLRRNEFEVWAPPISKNLPGLLSDFSHKTAATKAGLGWVGKSALFVSHEFGPGMRLATVLTDAPLVCAEPVVASRCADCAGCVEVCPYGAIRGEQWYPGIARDELLDAQLCSEKREEHIPALGFKHPCGLCIRACPFGQPGERDKTRVWRN